MALLGNYTVLNRSPMRKFSGTQESCERSNFGTSGSRRNAQMVDRTTNANELYAMPQGSYAGLAWMLPQQAGGIASINSAGLTVSPVGTAYGGITTTGSSDLLISIATASGQLVSSGQGSASMLIATSTPLLTASISGSGAAAFVLASNTPLLGALAGSSGYASMSISGSLAPYAVGNMSGTTIDPTIITPAAIAGAVWSADASQYLSSGTTGYKLNSAASGGVDYGAMSAAVRVELSSELLRIVEIAKIHGLVQGVDLVVTKDGRLAGTISQTITDDGVATTVSRNA